MNNKEQVLKTIQEKITHCLQQIALLERIDALLGSDIDRDYDETHNGIDIQYPGTHAATVEIMKRLAAGHWEKEYNNTSINYLNKTFAPPLILRIYCSPPPPSCQLVEYEVVMPAQPEHIEKRFKVVCSDDNNTPAATEATPV